MSVLTPNRLRTKTKSKVVKKKESLGITGAANKNKTKIVKKNTRLKNLGRGKLASDVCGLYESR